MPSSVVVALIERVSKLEAKVESLLVYQKWQMGFLGAIFVLVVGALVKH